LGYQGGYSVIEGMTALKGASIRGVSVLVASSWIKLAKEKMMKHTKPFEKMPRMRR